MAEVVDVPGGIDQRQFGYRQPDRSGIESPGLTVQGDVQVLDSVPTAMQAVVGCIVVLKMFIVVPLVMTSIAAASDTVPSPGCTV